MAWRNVTIPTLESIQGTIAENSTAWLSSDNIASGYSYPSDFTFSGVLGEWLWTNFGTIGNFLFGDDSNGFYLDDTSSSGSSERLIFAIKSNNAYVSGSDIQSCVYSYATNSRYNVTFYAGVNDETQKGTFFFYLRDTTGGRNGIFVTSDNSLYWNSSLAYTILTNAIPPAYTWQSVPSISGKNGILSLAQIKDDYINEGESVSGASADHFTNLSTENRVDVLINDALPVPEIGGTTVTVEYTIPSLSIGSYEYCKLVAKKNFIPESSEDGDKIIDIDPTSISASVKYLRGSTKYYFGIFVKTTDGYEAVSNVKSITTGETHDIVLFTNEFNDDILVDNWDITVYRSGWGNGNSSWNPSQFASDFLTAYNFLIGNSSKRTIYLGNGEITADQKTSMTDATFWIPIKRSNITENFKIEFDAKVDPQGYAEASYNYTWVAVGCVDSSNNWHQCVYTGGVPGRDWVHYETEITGWTYGYIDYIGLSDCDGKPHWKNIKIVPN